MSSVEISWALNQKLHAAQKMVLLVMADYCCEGHGRIEFDYLINRAGVSVDEAWRIFEDLEFFGLLERAIPDGIPPIPFVVYFTLFTSAGYCEPPANSSPQTMASHGNSSRRGFVYVIQAANNTCKIGISIDVEKRIRDLQRTSGKFLKLVRSFETSRESMRDVESAAHAHFHEHRVSGEWFDLSPDDAVEFLEAYLRRLA
jgi:predicted GIY-YIG superfamily endonuclease